MGKDTMPGMRIFLRDQKRRADYLPEQCRMPVSMAAE